MSSLTLASCAQILRCSGLFPSDTRVLGFSIDTRTLRPGDLFIAIPGDVVNGHDFLDEAQRRGAVGALISEKRSTSNDFPCLEVTDTIQALGQLGAWARAQFKGPVIGLTGSSGKTSTKELIASILRQALGSSKVAWTQGTLNNHLGVPLTLLSLDASRHQAAVIEMGANHLKEIEQLVTWVQPDVGLLLNAGPVHLEGFGSLDGVAQGKGEIFNGIKPNGAKVLAHDSPYFEYWKSLNPELDWISFGLHPEAHVRAENIQLLAQGSTFDLKTPEGSISIRLNVLGQHQVLNALAAAAASLKAGVGLMDIKAGLESTEPFDRRMKPLKGLNQSQIINDAYNANPLAVEAALRYLVSLTGRKILVFSDMLELGPEAVQYHRAVGQQAAQWGVNALYVVGDLAQETAFAFQEAIQSHPELSQAAHIFETQADLIAALKSELAPGVTVLVKASKGQALWPVAEACMAPEKVVPQSTVGAIG